MILYDLFNNQYTDSSHFYNVTSTVKFIKNAKTS